MIKFDGKNYKETYDNHMRLNHFRKPDFEYARKLLLEHVNELMVMDYTGLSFWNVMDLKNELEN